jgi:hypothetical protein
MDGAKKQTFFWQGFLILLPVILLTLAGIPSIGRDQANSRREGNERARVEASRCVSNVVSQFHPFASVAIASSADENAIRTLASYEIQEYTLFN